METINIFCLAHTSLCEYEMGMLTVRAFDKDQVPKVGPLFSPPLGYSKLCIEIGAGAGLHAIHYSKSHSDTLTVAIEKTANKFKKLDRRLTNHPEIENLIAVHANAINWISQNIAEQSVDQYFILYPNPYPKDPQKRWFRMPFMQYLIRTLKVGGTITLATNDFEYYEESKNYNSDIWGLQIIEDRIVSITEKPRTHFEKKYLLRGETCFSIMFKRCSSTF